MTLDSNGPESAAFDACARCGLPVGDAHLRTVTATESAWTCEAAPLARFVVMLSGGAGSWAAAKRLAAIHGPESLALLFTDVGDGSNPYVGEDSDTYRFLYDGAADIGAPLTVLRDGRTIWDVFTQKKWLGNSSLSHCSWELKTKPARRWIEENYPDPATVTVVVGIDWTETHRLPAIVKNWQPYTAIAPLCERPFLGKIQVLDMLRKAGLKPPRLYSMGFAHANCIICVKAGQAHFKRALEVFPEHYAYAEEQEQLQRERLGDVSILKDRTGGELKPLTLREFRQDIEAGRGGQIDMFDEGGCGCMVEPEPGAAA